MLLILYNIKNMIYTAVRITIITHNIGDHTLVRESINLMPFTDTARVTDGIFCSLAVESCKINNVENNIMNSLAKDTIPTIVSSMIPCASI